MPNPLFQNGPQPQNQGIFGILGQIRHGGPQAMVEHLVRNNPQMQGMTPEQVYQTNPEFRDFANSMRGKTPEQAFRENGLDFNQFRGMM